MKKKGLLATGWVLSGSKRNTVPTEAPQCFLHSGLCSTQGHSFLKVEKSSVLMDMCQKDLQKYFIERFGDNRQHICTPVLFAVDSETPSTASSC